MAATDIPKIRTYGNWRKPRSSGLGSWSSATTVTFFVGAPLTALILMATNLLVALVFGVLLALLLLTMTRQDKHGRSVMARAATRHAFRRSVRSKANLYRSGPLGSTPWGTNQLPGLAAQTELSEWTDSWARPFGLIRLPSKNYFTMVLQGEPDGGSLVDQSQVDLWVAHWGAWLNTLGNEPGLVAASVTIDTAPDSGARLRREIESVEDPGAPELAKEVMRQIMDDYPRGSANVRALIAITFKGQMREGGQKRTTEDVATDLASRIGLIGQQLSSTGAGSVRPLSAQELCEYVRVSYDPAVANVIAEARARKEPVDLDWANVGPVGADASWDSYRHDSGFSRTWQMSQAPRGEIYANVLQRLLEPSRAMDRKRVTLLYRPLDAARSADIVEKDRKNAQVRVTSSDRPSLRTITEYEASLATAREEARGAGLVNFGMLVTATVMDENRLADAAAAVENLAAGARLFLRPMNGSQDSGFSASLPLGLVLPEYQLVSASFTGGK